MEHRPPPTHREPCADPDAVLLPVEVYCTEPLRDQGAEAPRPVAGERRNGIHPEGGEAIEDTTLTHGSPLLLRPGRTVISRVDDVSMLEEWSPGNKELFFGNDKFTKNEK
jgi:hypothetical protein